jgi:hypothetical protein
MAPASAEQSIARPAKPTLSQPAPVPSAELVSARVPFKHRNTTQPLAAWTVSLQASVRNLWPTQYTTLTAIANQSVGPTPYYLSIYDDTAGNFVAVCASGTRCLQPAYRRARCLVR